jgi:energy-converting hydrogenase A subunit R
MPQPNRVYVSDCEGPISKNDNAFEITHEFVPDGDKLFSVLSKYDDIQADVVKRLDYNAGDTLKLVLPFLKAFDVTEQKMREFSANNILLVPGAKDTLKRIRSYCPSFIVSTSYQQYISALCDSINFPVVNTYSTRVKIDDYEIAPNEKTRLQELSREIAKMPVMRIPKLDSSDQFSEEDNRNITRLDNVIWEEISKMEIGRVLKEVKPVGGHEKAKAVDDVVKRQNTSLSEVMYVGDSITDEEVFKKVRTAGGLTVSFNGNNYAVYAAELGVMSPHTHIMAELAAQFYSGGKEEAIDYASRLPIVKVLTDENKKEFSESSSKFRKTIRGEAVGKLG